MKFKLTLAGLVAAAVLLPAAHAQTTGTSHPERLDDQITTAPNPATEPHYVKPSPDVAAPAAAAPVTGNPTQAIAAPPTVATAPVDPDSTFVGSGAPIAPQPATTTAQAEYAPPVMLHRTTPPPADPDGSIVISVPDLPGQMNEGTILHVVLQTPLSTTESHVGDTFLAALTQPVTQNGVVLLPIGSQIRGRVTELHGGRRITGPASIRLEPQYITLPDGTSHRLFAEVARIDSISNSHVSAEGAIVDSGNSKAALTTVAATTGGAAVTGAVLGGGVGAVVGAGVGAGVGTIWWLRRDIQQSLPAGTRLSFSLDAPLSVAQPTP
ncbi:MAG TPA: hypothetical protein VMD97_08525 [Candidatus Aquilonibacter sp.]|nr:hypothetical protein [Candidatus Aquilonibacter sp.]